MEQIVPNANAYEIDTYEIDKIVPNEIVPNEIVPNEIVPNEIVPNEIVPNANAYEIDKIVPNANEMGAYEIDKIGTNAVSQMSILDFLVNPMYQNTIKKQKELKKDNSADIKFYRKRIISLCKDMLKDRFESEELKKIHDNYVNEIIFYFKMKDTNDILQSQYISIIDEVKEIEVQEDQAKQDQAKQDQAKQDQAKQDQAKQDQAQAQQNQAQTKQIQEVLVKPMQQKQVQDTLNKNIMRKKITSTLDNYVTIVKKDEELPTYPVKKEINLKTSSLKNKGVRINEKNNK